MKSYIAKPAEVERKWYVVDAEGKTLGRLASEVASVLRGKKKPIYTPHVDCGDYVIVVNAEKVAVTGKKRQEKIYKRIPVIREASVRPRLQSFRPRNRKRLSDTLLRVCFLTEGSEDRCSRSCTFMWGLSTSMLLRNLK